MWWSVTMATTYDGLSSRWSSHFWVKMPVLTTLFNIKVKPVNEMMQRAYLNVILHVKHKKLSFIAILTWFLILGEIQDGNHFWWRHWPPSAPPPVNKIINNNWINLIFLSRSKAFHWRQNRFKILQIILIKNSVEGFHPPLPLIPRWGMNLRVRTRVTLLN